METCLQGRRFGGSYAWGSIMLNVPTTSWFGGSDGLGDLAHLLIVASWYDPWGLIMVASSNWDSDARNNAMTRRKQQEISQIKAFKRNTLCVVVLKTKTLELQICL